MIMTEKNVHIRTAQQHDIPLIFSFISQLAVYEKMEDEVVATEALLNEWLFEKKIAEVILVSEDDKEVGFAPFFHNFSTFVGRG